MFADDDAKPSQLVSPTSRHAEARDGRAHSLCRQGESRAFAGDYLGQIQLAQGGAGPGGGPPLTSIFAAAGLQAARGRPRASQPRKRAGADQYTPAP